MNRRKAKIVCTIGPATSTREAVLELVRGGMNVARLNFSHGTHESHQKSIALIRECASICGKSVTILQDLQGIKIRVGKVRDGGVLLKTGSELSVSGGEGESDDKKLFISHANIALDAEEGDRILIDDGLIRLKVTEKGPDVLKVKVVEGGILKDNKGVNLPFPINIPAFTDKDAVNLEFGLKAGLDYAAISFVRTASDIRLVKKWLESRNASIPLIAKIEKPEALDNIAEIIAEADGIMIARGDLGIEVSPEAVPVLQKSLIDMANRAGKLVITATQMLESMTEHSQPTRAEAGDVANAVIDGSDALMLSAETASGKHPVEAVRMMARIIRFTENKYTQPQTALRGVDGSREKTRTAALPLYSEAIACAACKAAEDIEARYIVTVTRTGHTALLVSKFRPASPIIAFTFSEAVSRKMALCWGINPQVLTAELNTDNLITAVEEHLLSHGYAQDGDRIVLMANVSDPRIGATNFMKLHTVGEKRRGLNSSDCINDLALCV
jgi:pyruvate kinase